LVSLTTTGFDAFFGSGSNAGECLKQFPNYCYFVMWFFNVQAGFRCINDNKLPNGALIQPSCKNMCNNLLFNSCPMFKSALKQTGSSDWMLCEYFSNSNCYNSGDSSWIPKVWVTLVITIPVVLLFIF
jgi:hypothetical protein